VVKQELEVELKLQSPQQLTQKLTKKSPQQLELELKPEPMLLSQQWDLK
jgi:hypothetical protein